MKMTKDDIIRNMCLTYNHAFFLADKAEDDDNPLNCAMTASEKEYLIRQMTQIYNNDIEPYMEIKDVDA